MQPFIPERVFFEPQALSYPLGRKLIDQFHRMNIPVWETSTHNRILGIPGKTAPEAYKEAKQTLVVAVRRSKSFQTCKPSAHFQLPLATSCPGMCEYCYLATTLGPKPYLRVYVNIDEILDLARQIIETRSPETTVFEGAATSDPIPVEPYTGSLAKTVEFFGLQEYGRFRLVTKFTAIDTLLGIRHNGHTRFRFTLNCDEVIRKYEHRTPSAADRIAAAGKVLEAGYPLGILIAPIFVFPGWEEAYKALFENLSKELKARLNGRLPENLTFEFITHRFTKRAKAQITKVFPHTTLPLEENTRRFKFGQFGYGKYLYPEEDMAAIKHLFTVLQEEYFPGGKIEYFV